MTSNLRRLPLAAVLLSLTATAGCLEWEEGMCSEGEVPLYSIEYRSGGQCIAEGGPVPDGMATYPPGRVPQMVGDKYDRWPLGKKYPWADEVRPGLRQQARELARQDPK